MYEYTLLALVNDRFFVFLLTGHDESEVIRFFVDTFSPLYTSFIFCGVWLSVDYINTDQPYPNLIKENKWFNKFH